jgi:4-amino-4-deoxy-L-arabinose transferase-like glycosyltransferase
MDEISRGASRLIVTLFLLVALQALFCVPRLSWELAAGDAGPLGVVFGLAAAVLAVFLLWRRRERARAFLAAVGDRLERIPRGAWMAGVLLLGVALRLLWAWLFPAHQSSDGLSYSNLAAQLARGEPYRTTVSGSWAEWPPGYPLLLSVFYLIAGVNRWSIVLLNLVLFIGTVQSTDALARRLGGEGPARLAALLVAVWPNLIATVGIAAKELLVVFLVTTALTLWLDARAASSSKVAAGSWLAAGLALGLASLAQPAVLLFPAVLIAWDFLTRPGTINALAAWALLGVGLALAIGPWSMRNFGIFHQPVLISTNGGSVFYRANNPLATGAWIDHGERRLDHLSELEASAVGYRWGLEWIRNHPKSFLALAVRKQVLFLGDDGVGVYETLKRGLGMEGPLYTVLKVIASGWWWGLWLAILLAVSAWRPAPGARSSGVLLLLLAVLYFWLIDSIFESGARHHVPLAGVVAVLAALTAARWRDAIPD